VTELSLRLAVSFVQILAEVSIVMLTVAIMTLAERNVGSDWLGLGGAEQN